MPGTFVSRNAVIGMYTVYAWDSWDGYILPHINMVDFVNGKCTLMYPKNPIRCQLDTKNMQKSHLKDSDWVMDPMG